MTPGDVPRRAGPRVRRDEGGDVGVRDGDAFGGSGGGGDASDAAAEAIRLLVATGKVSAADAEAALSSARRAGSGRGSGAGAKAPVDRGDGRDGGEGLAGDGSDNDDKGSNGSGSNHKGNGPAPGQKVKERSRTRHVALQFSYDGTDFSGFAQNVGKDCDNSVEKALFAALEKTRLLLPLEENGATAACRDESATGEDGEGGSNGENGEGVAEVRTPSARTAARYSRCGRTDRGVHAHGQVVALYLKSAFPLLARTVSKSDGGDDGEVIPGEPLDDEALPKNSLDRLDCFVPPKKSKGKGSKGKGKDGSHAGPQLQRRTLAELDYPRILNNVLPPSIRILGWCPVSSQFSARFSCSRRTYRYFFPRRDLDLSLMAEGLKRMMGKHDFRNLCKMNCEQVYNFERTLLRGKVVSPERIYVVAAGEEGGESTMEVVDNEPSSGTTSTRDMCHVEIVGQAFLWHQIRCIMSILFYVGRKLESPAVIGHLLDVQSNPAKPSYEMAAEGALVLQDCQFARLELGRTVRNLWDVTKVLEERWEAHAVAAERARDALESAKNETCVRWTDVVDFVQQIDRDRRRKEQKRSKRAVADDGEVERALAKRAPVTDAISWGSAVTIIQDVLGVRPQPPSGRGQGQKGHTDTSIHVPLMERSRGTTYEEKVRSILGGGGGGAANDANGKSSKRKERYEENIIKKRKTAEEDQAFYDHMLRQGGSSV
ncbi:hypothetical protein ACHAWF_006107 [Thalassiosira exigua]